MSYSPHSSRLSAPGTIQICLLAFWLLVIGVPETGHAAIQARTNPTTFTAILDLIHRQKYNEAITRLEQVLEKNPADGEALTYMATANLYHDLNFTKAQKEFTEAFKAGGGATFFVTHSHEKFAGDDIVDYCRGWLHLRLDGGEFVPIDGSHGFKFRYNEVEEFKQNRFSKAVFHIKVGGKSQNFRGRSNGDLEPLLIIALYKSFARN
jgi:tetratricopeptide (TPR) repeat protein